MFFYGWCDNYCLPQTKNLFLEACIYVLNSSLLEPEDSSMISTKDRGMTVDKLFSNLELEKYFWLLITTLKRFWFL